MQNFLYKKKVDWSCLNLGINIPINLQNIFYNELNLQLKRGDSCKIKLIVDNVEYNATLYNIFFDIKKYETHKDLLQIRYTPNSQVAKKFQQIFHVSYDYLIQQKMELKNKRKQIKLPENISEFLILYTTEFRDTFICDYIINSEVSTIQNNLVTFEKKELDEILENESNNSSIIEKYQLTKVRNLDKSINNKLKKLYDYTCQICGEKIGEKYNSNLIHAHHIERFSLSMNNLPKNIMIVCPNHHGIIHNVNPIFNSNDKIFIYENGYIEKLQINYHL